ncbi:threonine synthase, partial [bacterium]|nr:threonine synthase [bacterium]
MKYFSTNKKAELVNFEKALLKGLAPDKGLYMPDSIPKLPPELIESFKTMKYHEIAFHVAKSFLSDLVDDDSLRAITKDAYDFDVPLQHVYERKYVMRLDQGPTASFKDFAARMMARLMQYFMKKGDDELLILVATSGDTGSAIANAYYGLDNIKVLVLFPIDEVSDRQRKQMTTLGKNISTLAVDGKFDDCQTLVKQAFSDSELENLNLTSANSINFGRLLPQTVYYFWAYSQLSKNSEEITFSIPSGNFGDMMGALLASKMGLPIKNLVIPTNENDEFPRFLETGVYNKIEPSKACL